MTLNFDLTSMPQDCFIWAATHKGEVVRTRFIAKSKAVKEPFWSGVGAEACILAWQPFIKPAHPVMTEAELVDALDALVPARVELAGIMSTVPGADFLPIIVGGL
jgi:hypothetical protein